MSLPDRKHSIAGMPFLLSVSLFTVSSFAYSAAQTPVQPSPEVASLTAKGSGAAAAFKFDEAIDTYNEALKKAREIKDAAGEAQVLSNLGGVYPAAGLSRKAVEPLRRAIELFRETGNKVGVAGAQWKLGEAYFNLGRLDKALECDEAALPLFRSFGGTRGEALVMLDMGEIYDELGQPKRALELFTTALTIFRKLNGKRGEANALNGIANICRELAQPQQALENYKLAMPLFRELGGKHGEAKTLANMGMVYGDLDQTKEARDCFDQALAIQRSSGDGPGQIITLYGLGTLASKQKKPKEALDYFGRAYSICKMRSNRTNQSELAAEMGSLYAQLGDFDRAETSYREAISLYEGIRASLGGLSEAKSTFLASHVDVYYACLKLLLARNEPAKAFWLVQKTKARSLLDLLYSGRVDVSAAISPVEREQEQELRQHADELNRAMVNQGVENEPGSKARYEKLKEELKAVESKLQALTDSIYARHPDLAQKRAARAATLKEVELFLPNDAAILEYVVAARDDIRLFVLTNPYGHIRVNIFRIPGTVASLAALASGFRDACSNPAKPFRPTAASLTSALIRPAFGVLQNKKRYIICPDGPLWDVSFAALWSGRGHAFLGDLHEISYAYSATGAGAAVSMASRRAAPNLKGILVCANPSFGSSDRFGDLKEMPGQRPLDTASRPIDAASRPIEAASRPLDVASRAVETVSRSFDSASRGKAIPTLPGTQQEADALQHLFSDATVLTGDKAQETEFKASAPLYRYLHLATHGFVNDGSPLLSSVVLAKPSPASKDDGFLTAREIYGLNLKAEMTVLSACNTARGENRTGDGVIGLTWALYVAGCPTQVVSQWAVDDKSTAMLMGRFYENLKLRKMGKAAALREAQSWLRSQNPKYRHPYYWAPFVLNGAWK